MLWMELVKVFSVAVLSRRVSLFPCHTGPRQKIPMSQNITDFPLSFFVVRVDGLLELFGRPALPFAGRSASDLVLFVFRRVPY